MKKTIKMQFPKSKEVNGVIYNAAKISFMKTKLKEMGIDEKHPIVEIEYDTLHKKIIITPVK
jgi:hypothetical protein